MYMYHTKILPDQNIFNLHPLPLISIQNVKLIEQIFVEKYEGYCWDLIEEVAKILK